MEQKCVRVGVKNQSVLTFVKKTISLQANKKRHLNYSLLYGACTFHSQREMFQLYNELLYGASTFHSQREKFML